MSTETGGSSSPYDEIAPLYDRVYAHETGGWVNEAALIAKLSEQYRPEPRSILDLGSGTGRVFRELAKVMPFKEMVGVEQSSQMIRQARRYVADAEFIQDDITDFELDRRFDVVSCIRDTINEVTTAEGWIKLFDRAAEHLKPGGLFIFDMTPRIL